MLDLLYPAPASASAITRAASLVERMRKDGLVGPANHVGKREIIYGNRDNAPKPESDDLTELSLLQLPRLGGGSCGSRRHGLRWPFMLGW